MPCLHTATAIPCAGCAISPKTGASRLPAGWKRRGAEVYCRDCWRERYILRAVTLRVAEPEGGWKALDAALRDARAACTAVANWATCELYARDAKPTGAPGERITAMQRVYLYPEVRARWPQLASQTVASLLQAVERKYRARRLDLWRAKVSLPTYRYPTPLPLHNASWTASLDAGNRPMVSVRIGDQRLSLRLAGGPRYRRQRAQFLALVSGDAVQGEAAILRHGTGPIQIKLVGWFPRREAASAQKPTSGTLYVSTRRDMLLAAVKSGRVWRYHGDHVRRWSAEHTAQLQRWGDDQKAEERPVPSFAERRERAAAKYHARMDSATHQISAMLASYAQRARCASVAYDDSERGYCPQFPYAELRRKLAEKLDAAGIELLDASAEVQQEIQAALEEGKSND